MVYDLGGGTFEVKILNIRNSVYEVKATGGNKHLGGVDFDNILMATLAAEFKRKSNMDIAENKKALRKLRTACERAKRFLSTAIRASIDIDSLADGIDFVTYLTRARFDELCAPLFRITINVVESTLKDIEMTCDDIDTVVLVGGSTRIPKIQQLLQNFFKGKKIDKTVNPDEAVAYGAAVQAAIIHGNASKELANMELLEVTPLTLGVSGFIEQDQAPHMLALIKRNTPIPVSISKIFGTNVGKNINNIKGMKILQGESHLEKDNFTIGLLKLVDFRKVPESVEVTFSIDDNGILSVIVVSTSNRDIRNGMTIENVSGGLTKAEIERMVADAEKYGNEDREVKRCHTARWELEQYCNEAMHGSKTSTVKEKCNEIRSWLECCYRPTISQFHNVKNELTALIISSSLKSLPRNLNENGYGNKVDAATVKIEVDENGNDVNDRKKMNFVQKPDNFAEEVVMHLPETD